MFFLRCLLLLFLIPSWVYPDPYEHHVENVLNNGHTVKLGDGSFWEIKEDFEEAKNWQFGDSIVLDVKSYLFERNEYFFKNLRLNTSLQIKHLYDSQLPDHIVYTIEGINYPQYLSLSDNSVWRYGFLSKLFSTNDWKKGDRILTFKSPDLLGYNLINLVSSDDYSFFYSNTKYLRLCFNKDLLVYRHFITEVGPSTLKMDNGFVWNWAYLIKPSFQLADHWQKDDEVCFIYHAKKVRGQNDDTYMHFYIINLRNFSKIRASYSTQTEEWLSYQIENIVINRKKGFLNLILFDYASITLNDGSNWIVNDYSVTHWGVGDRILVSQSINSSPEECCYTLINPDYGCNGNWISQRDYYLHSAVQGRKID